MQSAPIGETGGQARHAARMPGSLSLRKSEMILLLACGAVLALSSLAALLESRIDAPSHQESPAEPRVARLRVNDASAAELAVIPGIGPSLGERVVAERELRGSFRSLEDLLARVSRLPDAKLREFAPHLEFAEAAP